MQRIVVDQGMSDEFRKADNLTEICDPAGIVVGYFRVRAVPREVLKLSERSLTELRRRAEERTGRPLADVIRDLERRG
jgi:hypothetical protein